MRALLLCLSWSALLLSAACNPKSSSSTAGPTVLAEAEIGPEGGQLAVDAGEQQGLRLTIPPGVVAGPTRFRIVDDLSTPGAGTLVYAVGPGSPFRIEPSDLAIPLAATLRAPYRPANVLGTAFGNVRVQQVSPYAEQEHAPIAIDADTGWVEVRTKTFGRFQVVSGQSVGGSQAYLPTVGTSAALADGFAFAIEPVDGASPFAAQGAAVWRIMRPEGELRLYVVGDQWIGRESDVPSWRERFDAPFRLFAPIQAALAEPYVGTMRVEQPIGGLEQPGASLWIFGYGAFAAPRELDGRLVLDVLRLRLELTWDRSDIGVGQQVLEFWFSPTDGILAYAEDGVLHERLP